MSEPGNPLIRSCCYCGRSKGVLLRPFGPDGADSCTACAHSTPEWELVATQQYRRQNARRIVSSGGPGGVGFNPYPSHKPPTKGRGY